MASNLVLCGRVVKPHGLKGELSIELFAHSPFFLDNFEYIYLKLGFKRPVAFKIISWRSHQKRILLTVENILDRTEAEKWRGAEIYFPEDKFPSKEEGEYYLYELIGWRVYLDEGSYLGEIKDIKLIGDSEIWEIETLDGQEVLFPATEDFIIDMIGEKKKAIIAPPEGLLEIYLQK
ncbi:ribosome maturation factor RimM [Desulfonauticus submarinus]